ncbi:CDP-diacylglycerol--glycerol-3-phosphate 3-phosphatidyltransferase [Sphingomonas immobilis]|uniref:CDP-diacylglycerol--glycerol-3-phosphate 3-phosphatidyltransferase n=1 Tax=Sphingomonas immobilis TaxID=3063997 RepID=A0ABT8ZYU1_9SPHN|nr:CDP-diacylglycerol--glycerol-3-phosphate 3-phosphatidyltransferase [Sphingomonas sp. CA1-15]MDO7842372.1 CDP-diacylglycerol--glycerol-3-phosphate 3-phosphatidyltransferase [Sphingomonas sp. CA1-15]
MLTLPNLLTLSRIVAVPLLAWLLWWPGWAPGYAAGFVLYCLMGVTDYFDGYLARAQGTVSKLGVFLDPIADKIMVAAVILLLVGTRDASPPVIAGPHQIAALVILVREIAVSGLREFMAGLQVSVPVSQLAKWKTTLQLVALGGLILSGAVPGVGWVHSVSLVALWVAAVLTLITGWDYLRAGLKHMD